VVLEIEENGMFSVRSIYKKLEALTALDEVPGEEMRVFTQVWKCAAPSKVVDLSWKALLNRIPTRLNLVRRNAIPNNIDLLCVFCNEMVESTNHLLVHCRKT
jgi:hypothetical protein